MASSNEWLEMIVVVFGFIFFAVFTFSAKGEIENSNFDDEKLIYELSSISKNLEAISTKTKHFLRNSVTGGLSSKVVLHIKISSPELLVPINANSFIDTGFPPPSLNVSPVVSVKVVI